MKTGKIRNILVSYFFISNKPWLFRGITIMQQRVNVFKGLIIRSDSVIHRIRSALMFEESI